MNPQCFYCHKEVVADKEGNIIVGYLPSIQTTNLDMPYCNDDCFLKMKLSKGIIEPKTKKEKFFMLEILKEKLKISVDVTKMIKGEIKELGI